MTSRYILGAYWPARKEVAEECCERLARFLAALVECDPAFMAWYERGRSQKKLERRVDFKDRHYLLNLLERGRNRRDVGGDVIEELGFNIGIWNGLSGGKAASVSIGCGLYWISSDSNANLGNSVVLTLPKNLDDLGRPENMARILSVVAEAWEPGWAGVMSRDAMNTRNFDPDRPFVDWMTYVPAGIGEVPAPSLVHQLPGLGSIVLVQPTAPSGSEPGELARIRKIDEILQKAG